MNLLMSAPEPCNASEYERRGRLPATRIESPASSSDSNSAACLPVPITKGLEGDFYHFYPVPSWRRFSARRADEAGRDRLRCTGLTSMGP